MFDSEAHAYFGFDLVLDSVATTKLYHVTFEPLSSRPVTTFDSARAEWIKVPLKEMPQPQTLRLGRTLTVRLVTADGKHAVIEQIRIKKCKQAA
jgi:hypothetical protein